MPTVSIDWIGADARLFDDDFFTSDDADQTMVELVEVLNELCPPFVYFGTLEGDGADFGFWPDMPRITEEMRNYPENYDTTSGEVTLTDDNVIVQVSDHGNVTLMDMERNVIWSVV